MKYSALTDQLFNGFADSIVDVNNASTLPPLCYTDPEFFEFEKEAVFSHEWLCVGRESWVSAPGDYFTATHVGEPIVVVRNREDQLRAFSTVCRHRAMLVAEGHGNTRAFMCPYHHWTYSLDGELVGAPAMEKACGFDKANVRLPEFKLEVWLGFIFINFDVDAEPLAPRLQFLADTIANYRAQEADGPRPDGAKTWPWNWKVLFENNNDAYHANRLHRGLHDVIPSALCSFPEVPANAAGYFRFNGMAAKDGAINPLQRAILRIFPHLTDEERHRAIYANVPPSLTLSFKADQIGYFILHADSAEQVTVVNGVLYAPGAMTEPFFEERRQINVQTSIAISAQDRHVDAMVQRGLRSRYAPRGRYSWQEQTHREFNAWLVERYTAAWSARRQAAE